MPESLPPPDECANCGASIPRNARACPECGADERTGWRETSLYDDLDLPEEAYAEPGDASRHQAPMRKINKVPLLWWLVAVVMLVLFTSLVLGL